MKFIEIVKKAQRLFRRGSGVIQGIEDHSKVSEYSFTVDVNDGQEIAMRKIKALISQSPWTSTARPPEVLIANANDGTKKLEIRFGVISATKAKSLEDGIRKMLSKTAKKSKKSND